MFRDEFELMVTKYCADAENEMVASGQRRLDEKLKRELTVKRYGMLKYSLLLLVVAVIAGFIHFRSEIGSLAAEFSIPGPDPTLVAPPVSKAKVERKMSEMKKQQEDELNEIMN